MVLRAVDGDAAPRNALQILNRADLNALCVQNRALLDVQLDKRVRPDEQRACRSGIADAPELVAEPFAVDADGIQRRVHIQSADVDQRAEHIRREAHALLVGKRAHRQRPRGLCAAFHQRLNDLKSTQHAGAAVVLSGVDDRIDVRAEHDRLAVFVFLRLPDAELVADAVGHDGQSRLRHPLCQQVAAGLVLIRRRQPHAPSGRVQSGSAQRVNSVQ